MLRKPSVSSVRTCAPCTVSSIIARTDLATSGLAIAFLRWSSFRNRKCSDITPACGLSVAALAALAGVKHSAIADPLVAYNTKRVTKPPACCKGLQTATPFADNGAFIANVVRMDQAPSGGAVLVLHDITELRKLDRIDPTFRD